MLTYKDAGVDIESGDKFVENINRYVKSTYTKGVIGGLGGFAALFRPELKKMKEPLLVSSTDGVGTKLKFAFLTGKHDTVGIDLVAMCVNDLVVVGAKPLFMLDYFATGKLELSTGAEVIKGIAKGCREAGCALIGGETAEMPYFYKEGEYDLAGFVVGIVDRSKIIDGRKVKPGDVLIGVESSGIHSNGYSLVRKIFFDIKKLNRKSRVKGFEGPFVDTLLKPTKIYVKPALMAVEKFNVKAMAHITGSGLAGNIPRVLPRGTTAIIKKNSFPVLPVFRWLKENGDVPETDMYNTFNMGIGYVFVVSKAETEGLIKLLSEKFRLKSYRIGEIISSGGEASAEII
ncbi:MAG: phosphoribosylformylglycinamidine cyclo-ligase [Deltaproteobacteria bacterium]|nr:phosphoribosylformylglycinamidine cyclo-ligase [Deltaproteobacteria bacterium]